MALTYFVIVLCSVVIISATYRLIKLLRFAYNERLARRKKRTESRAFQDRKP